ncbi:MAG: METTL5 family protein [Methanocellales archaeon]|nr:METTL5 family protein [Methanocellales archaeon]
MKKKQLEILLEGVQGFYKPDLRREQYLTPAPIAAELLHFAHMRGDLSGTVCDLGCGTGILAIGAKLLGAEKVIGVDSDLGALRIARANAKNLGVDVEFICCDVMDFAIHEHRSINPTVIMNPPFGAQIKGSDRPFLRKALEIGKTIYSLHNVGSMEFVSKYIQPYAIITDCAKMGFPMKRTFEFHKKDIEMVNVELYRLERREKDAKNKG